MSTPTTNSSHQITLTLMALTMGFVLVSPGFAQHSDARSPQIGLEGYCPVCVIEARKWERGRPEYQTTYDGVIYYFPNATIKQKFDATPAKYVPALRGDCIVCYEKSGKRVPGSIRFATVHRGRLHLFPSEAEKRVFNADPTSFENTDLAANGDCVVCLVRGNQRVTGSPEFTEVHNGFRYQFPSAREQFVFRRSPGQFATQGAAMSREPTTFVAGQRPATRLVTVSGSSTCAACEFGVRPLSNPEELGLALKTPSGNIVVVENAHKLYPKAYEARYQGQQLQVRGEIIKRDGDIAWLRPSALRVVN